MSKWYVVKLWRTSPSLTVAVAAFCCLQAFFMIKRIHNFPFFIYDMYSRPVPEPKTVVVPVLYINGKLMDHTQLPNWKEGAFTGMLKTYSSLKDGEGIAGRAFRRRFGDKFPIIRSRISPDRDEISRFPSWMAGFLERCYGMPVQSYKMGYRHYSVEDRQISITDHVEEIRVDWTP